MYTHGETIVLFQFTHKTSRAIINSPHRAYLQCALARSNLTATTIAQLNLLISVNYIVKHTKHKNNSDPRTAEKGGARENARDFRVISQSIRTGGLFQVRGR